MGLKLIPPGQGRSERENITSVSRVRCTVCCMWTTPRIL
nr:MAG TPA: hypothetical protein [Caudoviricetes sp.]